MSDLPVESLGGLTPLEKAHTPNMDMIAAKGRLGLVTTIPEGFAAGTDVGTMSILGYDPARYHTGRSPIEAASMGIELGDDDIAFRCNLVTLEEREGETVMADFTAGHIGNDEAGELITAIGAELGDGEVEFHPGVSYRHLMVWHGGEDSMETTPPHDITDRGVGGHLPAGTGSERLLELSEGAREILAAHPVNERRRAAGLAPATDIWLWGQGRRSKVPTLAERFGISGGVITAVDVVAGLGRMAGLDRVEVPGITGFIDTNWQGKGDYALAALADHDLIFVHVEATDESGHMGDVALKVESIEKLDDKVIGTILAGMDRYDRWRIMVLPDHATPVSLKTHTADPVPFAILDSAGGTGSGRAYSEREAAATGESIDEGHILLEQFMEADDAA